MPRRAGRQFHNQPEASHQHGFLVALWNEVRERTAGALDIAVHPLNGGIAGSDPRVLEMLISGEIQFATMMGPLLSAVIPAAEIQGIPFAFADSASAHRAADGLLGEHLGVEAAAKGIYLVPGGALENGFRQICSVAKRVERAEDLAGYRMRVPAGRVLVELFEALGAEPVTVNIDGLRAALESGHVDGHENPLAITEVNHLHRVTRSVAITNHVWSAFNLIGNLAFWNALGDSEREVIHRAARTHVARQRAWTVELNRTLEARFAERGIHVARVDTRPFVARLGHEFYARCKERCGREAWRRLEVAAGPLRA